jgi:hypothetical protein
MAGPAWHSVILARKNIFREVLSPWDCLSTSVAATKLMPQRTYPSDLARPLRKDNFVEPWAIQLLTILGVVAGAVTSFISTRLIDRARWQRDEALRWDTRRLDSYGEFASATKHFIMIASRLCATRGLPGGGQPLDLATGLEALAAAEQDLGVKWEHVLMLGSPDAITAARDWRHVAWHLEWFARGLRSDPDEYEQANIDSGSARRRFYTAARTDLGIAIGPVPEMTWPPAWQSQSSAPESGG